MSEYERIEALRREWAPEKKEEVLCVAEPHETRQSRTPVVEVHGVQYQRCGGGCRVLRKRIGGT